MPLTRKQVKSMNRDSNCNNLFKSPSKKVGNFREEYNKILEEAERIAGLQLNHAESKAGKLTTKRMKRNRKKIFPIVKEELNETLRLLDKPIPTTQKRCYSSNSNSSIDGVRKQFETKGHSRKLMMDAKNFLQHNDWMNLIKCILLYVESGCDSQYYFFFKKYTLMVLKYDPVIERRIYLEQFLKGVLWLRDEEITNFVRETERVPLKSNTFSSSLKPYGTLAKGQFTYRPYLK